MIDRNCALCQAPMSRRELLWESLICRQCDEQLLRQPGLLRCHDPLSGNPATRLPGPLVPEHADS